MSVCATAFIGHPIGTQVAFFQHMHPQAACFTLTNRLGMQGPRVAIQNDVRDAFFAQKTIKRVRPLILTVLKGDIAIAVWPENAIACIKAHPPYLSPCHAQHPAKLVHKRAMGALKKKKLPLHACFAGSLPEDLIAP